MRRSVGVGRAIKARKERAAFQEKGAQLTEAKLEDMQAQLTQFRENLEAFAVKHKKQINKDPEFRSKFQTMCAKIGVDPLASNKGFWSEVLGVGKFFFELGVQIIHVCLATREANGGLIKLGDLVAYLQRIRARNAQADQVVTEEDVKRAIVALEPLGNGIKLLQVGADKMLVSVPLELSSDHAAVLDVAKGAQGRVSIELVQQRLGWASDRTERVVDTLLSQGMAWVDAPADGPREFWFPSLVLHLM